MSFETWAAFAAASTVLLIIPGPTILLVVSYALGQGWRTALPMAVGVALGDFTAMTLSMLGIGALLAASATVFTVLKWIGAAYLDLSRHKALPRRRGARRRAADRRRVGREDARPCLAGHRAQPEEPHLLRRLPAAVPRPQRRFPRRRWSIFETTFLVLAFANAFGYALVAARARSRGRQPAGDPHLQPDRRHAAGRRRHRHRGDALGQLNERGH